MLVLKKFPADVHIKVRAAANRYPRGRWDKGVRTNELRAFMYNNAAQMKVDPLAFNAYGPIAPMRPVYFEPQKYYVPSEPILNRWNLDNPGRDW